jgi:hypothetical protein
VPNIASVLSVISGKGASVGAGVGVGGGAGWLHDASKNATPRLMIAKGDKYLCFIDVESCQKSSGSSLTHQRTLTARKSFFDDSLK